DACLAGSCVGASPVVCAALDQCHQPGSCNPATGTCTNPAKANGASCDDGNPCTQTDTCQTGACSGANPVVCLPSGGVCRAAGVCVPSDPAANTWRDAAPLASARYRGTTTLLGNGKVLAAGGYDGAAALAN